MKLLKKGNQKLDKSILCWSITPVASCLNCAQCMKRCYALFPYRMYPKTKLSWDNNFTLAKTGEFKQHIIDQLSSAKKCKAVRIHVAGDFFTAEYILQWCDIVQQFPALHFYGYSKHFKIFPDELAKINNFPNCNIINSITEDDDINFGDADRVAKLVSLGYPVCPATAGEDVSCGKDCFICLTSDKVCFHVHR